MGRWVGHVVQKDPGARAPWRARALRAAHGQQRSDLRSVPMNTEETPKQELRIDPASWPSRRLSPRLDDLRHDPDGTGRGCRTTGAAVNRG